jgi:hypothetical protein
MTGVIASAVSITNGLTSSDGSDHAALHAVPSIAVLTGCCDSRRIDWFSFIEYSVVAFGVPSSSYFNIRSAYTPVLFMCLSA